MNGNDDVNTLVAVNRTQRQKLDPRYLKALKEDQEYIAGLDAAEVKEKAAVAAAPKPQPDAPKKESPGFWSETGRAVVGGARDAGQEVIDLIDESATWLTNNVMDLRFGDVDKSKPAVPVWKDTLPKVDKNETVVGGVARSITQFVVPFISTLKLMKAGMGVAAGGKALAGRAMAAGAVTDFAAFDPHEKRLSNLINEQAPSLANPISRYLASQDDDSTFEGRLKNAIEGMGLGLATEGVFAGVKAVARKWKGDGKTALDTKVEPTLARTDPVEEHLGDLVTQERSKLPANIDPVGDPRAGAVRYNGEIGPNGIPRIDVDGVNNPVGDPRATAGRVEIPPEEGGKILKDFETGNARSAYIDPDEGTVFMSRERPEGAAVSLDDQVSAALSRPPVERTATDLITLRAYRQLQEAAFPGLLKSDGSGMAKTARTDTLPQSQKDGTAVISDAERRAIREQTEELAQKITENGKQIDEVIKKWEFPTAASVAKAGLNMADKPITRGRGMRMGGSEAGGVSPTLLANIAAVMGGAAIGAGTADDDASFAERMNRAGVGALAGLGVKVGASRAKQTISKASEARKVADEARAEVVKSLSRPTVQNIAPRPAMALPTAGVLTKKAPRITSKSAEEMSAALLRGDSKAMAKSLEKSDFNFDNIDSDVDLKELMDAFSKQFEKETLTATRGVRTLDQQLALAKEIGTSPESLKEFYKDSGYMAEKAVAHRALLMASAEKVRAMAIHLTNTPQDLDGLLSFRKHIAVHASMQSMMKGVQSEIARSLGSFRIKASAVDFKADEVSALLDALGGIKANVDLAKKLGQITDPVKFGAVTRKAASARTEDAIFEAWVNGILSGPATTVVNVLGSVIVPLMNVGEKALAAGIGAIRPASKADRYRIGEAEQALRGYFDGMSDSLRISKEGVGELGSAATLYAKGAAVGDSRIMQEAIDMISGSGDMGNAWKTLFNKQAYQDSLGASQLENVSMRNAITSEAAGLRPDQIAGAAVDYIGSIIRTPGRAIMATDEVFKTTIYRGELRAGAYRQAANEQLEGAAFVARVKELTDTPTPDLSYQALLASRVGTFSDPLGSSMSKLQAFVGEVPLGRFILPFIRTPANIINFVGERTPLVNAYSKRVREDFMAGGSRRDMVLAQSAMGTMLYYGAYKLKEAGLISGGGDKNQQAERLGAKPQYSLKVGDTWYSFNRLDPVGMFFGLAADFADISGESNANEAGEIAATMMLALKRNIISKSYLKGITDLLMMAEDPERYGQAFINRYAGSIIPSAVNTVTKEQDPFIKEVWSAMDAIKARTPGYSKDVPNHVNLLGEEVKFADGWGPDFASPIKQMSPTNVSPLAREIGEQNADLRHPARTMSVSPGTPGIDLTPKQYHRLMIITGGLFKEHGEKLVASAAYKNLPSVPGEADPDYVTGKQYALQRMWMDATAAGKAKLLSEDKQLAEKFQQTKLNKSRVFMGLPPTPIND